MEPLGIMETAHYLVENASPTETAVALGASFAVAMAFSAKVRNAIRERANGYDEITGEYIGNTGECAHINHDKSSPDYDNMDNGLYTSHTSHWWTHWVDEDNGLNEAQNAWARDRIQERAKPTEKQKNMFGRWFNFD